jgi:SAM-dependent methyltransferase
MTDRKDTSLKAQSFFDDLWARGDPWQLETSDFERKRYARLIAMLDQSKYARILEIGCGAGAFTRLLAPMAQQLIALDVSSKAIAAARAAHGSFKQVEFRIINVMDYDPKEEGPWDLIVMSETIYYLGWLYSFFDVAWLASELFAATRTGGELLLANTQNDALEPLLHPSIIRTYHNLFMNVGYNTRAEEVFRGRKNGVSIEVLITLFEKCEMNERITGGG